MITTNTIAQMVREYNARYEALSPNGSISLLYWRGKWALTTAGSVPRLYASEETFSGAAQEFEKALLDAESKHRALGQTLGLLHVPEEVE